jgi:hypothetical protein
MDEIVQASIFLPRTGPVAQPLDHAVTGPLSDELKKLRTGVLTDSTTETSRAPYATRTWGVTHTYNVAIAKLGEIQIVAFLGEPYAAPHGREVTVADSLSLNGSALPSEVGDGFFIFRGGNGFDTAGDIDFQPALGGPGEHEGGEASPVVAATAAQLVALTAELVTINQPAR